MHRLPLTRLFIGALAGIGLLGLSSSAYSECLNATSCVDNFLPPGTACTPDDVGKCCTPTDLCQVCPSGERPHCNSTGQCLGSTTMCPVGQVCYPNSGTCAEQSPAPALDGRYQILLIAGLLAGGSWTLGRRFRRKV